MSEPVLDAQFSDPEVDNPPTNVLVAPTQSLPDAPTKEQPLTIRQTITQLSSSAVANNWTAADKSFLDLFASAYGAQAATEAVLITQRPMPVKGGGTMFLKLTTACAVWLQCRDLQVSPFSSAIWIDPAKWTVNLTLEGKRHVARMRKMDLGMPQLRRLTRPWAEASTSVAAKEAAKLSPAHDIAYECKISVNGNTEQPATYTAWLSEWLVPSSPVWQAKAEHMLQIRAQEKALTVALGTGSSAMPDEAEL